MGLESFCTLCTKLFSECYQGFQQVSRTWGETPQNLMVGLKSKHGGSMGELKILSKNTCEVVHLIKKLPTISLEASKFTKNELLYTSFSRILARF